MIDVQLVATTVVGALVGAIPSWFISRWFYRKSGEDLDAALKPYGSDARKALQALNVIGRMMEQARIGKPTFDEDGNLNGVVLTAHGNVTITPVTAKGFATFTPPTPYSYDREHEQPPSPEVGGSSSSKPGA